MKEEQLIKKTIAMLVHQYGYDLDQIVTGHQIEEEGSRQPDIVVFAKKGKKIQKEILVVIEIRTGQLLHSMYTNALAISMLAATAQYGMVYNGKEKICLAQEMGETTELAHDMGMKNYGEIFSCSDIPYKKKIKRSIAQEKITLENFATLRIKEIRKFLDEQSWSYLERRRGEKTYLQDMQKFLTMTATILQTVMLEH